MYFSTFLLCILSIAFVKADLNDDNIPSIDEQVAPLGTDNVFCLFTYGNWVIPANMQQYVPNAVYAGVSRLPFHRLDFNYYSEELQGNFPTIAPDCGYEVWGSIYLIPVTDLDTVLIKGGIVDNKKVFHFVQTVVEAYSNGNVINVKCNAFQQSNLPDKLIYGLPIPQDRRPSQQILDMLTESYSDGGLPKKYIDEVSQIPTRDQDYLQTNLGPKVQTQQPQPVVVAPDSVVVAPNSVVVAQDQNPQVTTVQPAGIGAPPMEHTVVVQPANNQQ